MKKATSLFLTLLLLLTLSACGGTSAPETEEGAQRLQIVATVFPAYDFAQAVAGQLADVSLLLPPGTEIHSYEPTPADMLQVRDCDLFLYLGGESDAWVDTILQSMDREINVLRLVDCVPLLEEETVEGMEDHEEEDNHDHQLGQVQEYDEHVWTAPENAAAITQAIAQALCELDAENAAAYQAGGAAYQAELTALDREFRDFFATVENRTIVFGDRFPLRYFAEAYDLDYYAAFPGCSTQTEPSAATIAFLTEKVRQEQLSTVFYIEFSNHLVADSIAEAAGAVTAQFHTCHNVSPAEMDAGATYLSLMRQNLETLQQAMA